MAHTDRDHPSMKRFWNWHEDNCGCGCHSAGSRYCYWNCSCLKADPAAPRGEFWIGPIDPQWKDDERRSERSHARNLMQRARSGHIDWDDLTIDYRRPYYW